jgi:hypothetical protein
LKEAIDTKAAWVKKRKRELLDDPSLLQIDDDHDEDIVDSQSPEYNPIQNVSVSEPPPPPAPTMVPTPVSSLHISRSLLKTTKY